MYNFLIIIGISLIFLGTYFDKENIKPNTDNKLEDIDQRLQNIEDILFSYEVPKKVPVNDATFGDILESVEVETETKEQNHEDIDNRVETFNVMSRLDSGEYTIEQACEILNMKKGEVLFLKNIYKKYQA